MRRLKILTWHTHGTYLYYLTQLPHDFYIISKPDRPTGYGGRCGAMPWGDNVIDMPAAGLPGRQFDCIIFQDDLQYLQDQHVLLDTAQRRLPKIYIEHDPPRVHPTDTRHPVDDGNTLLVHVTDFNALMWDNGPAPVVVIEHGVKLPLASWRGEQARGITVINNLFSRGRRLGSDIFFGVRRQIALDLAGMGSLEYGGIGEIAHCDLSAVCAGYRFFFNPIRYTSLGLAVIEAMMMGMPVVALATTEMSTVIENGKTGISANDPVYLIEAMRTLLNDHSLAQTLGAQGKRYACERFALARFAADWERALKNITA